MATVSTSLQLFDSFSRPLRNITQGMNLMLRTMEQMSQAAGNRNELARNFDVARQRISAAEAELHRAGDQQERWNRRIRQGVTESGRLTREMKNFAAVYLGFEAVKKVGQLTIGGAMEQQKMNDMLIARSGNVEAGTAMFDKFKAEALKSGMDVKDSLTGVLSFFSMTRNTDQISQLNNIAQRLAAFDTSGQGLDGAVFSVKEAMSGDILSLAERFNMSKAQIRSVKLDELGKKGDMEGFIKAFDKLLEMQSMGKKAFETMLKSPIKQAEILKNNVKSTFADAGQGAMKALLPLILTLNKAFQEGKFQSFFTALSTGLSILSYAFTGAVNGALWMFAVFERYWPEISGMALTLATIYLPMLISKLWAMVAPILAQAASWAVANLPILLVVAAVGLLIFTLRQFGVTTEQIVGFVVGAFYTLFAMIYNQVGLVWNTILAFAEFLVNIFIDPVYAVQKLFYDLAITFGGYMVNMMRSAEDFAGVFMKVILQSVNKALEGFNWLVDNVNGMFGADIKKAELLDANNVHVVSNKISEMMSRLEKPVSTKAAVDFSAYRMNQKNLKGAFDSGYTKGAGLYNKATNATKGFDLDKWNKNLGNIDKVGEVGKIKDKVDISNEDLKAMRELAEIKSIQNFVTLTPTVQVQTGDINNGHDIDTIIKRIEKHLEDEFTAAAAGVYT